MERSRTVLVVLAIIILFMVGEVVIQRQLTNCDRWIGAVADARGFEKAALHSAEVLSPQAATGEAAAAAAAVAVVEDAAATRASSSGSSRSAQQQQQCKNARKTFVKALWESRQVTDSCRAHVSMQEHSPGFDALDESGALRYLLKCERTAKLDDLASKLCKGVTSSGEQGGSWDLEQVFRVYRASTVSKSKEVDAVYMLKEHPKLQKCCASFPPHVDGANTQLVACLRASRPQDLSTVYATDYELTRKVLLYTQQLGSPIQSAIELGSGKGNWMASLGRAGVETVVGIEPGYMGSLAFYEDSWDARYEPVQLDSFMGDAGPGDAKIEAFLCDRFGSAEYQFDMVWSAEVFEHIPRQLHCSLVNRLAGLAKTWIFTSIAHPGQIGIGHISETKREDWLQEWEKRGFREVRDARFVAVRQARWSWFRSNGMLLRRRGPTVPVACP